jgi:hypothetical protein
VHKRKLRKHLLPFRRASTPLASVLGSVLGATLLVLLQNLLTDFRDYQSIVVGGILVAVLLFEPMGLRGRWLRAKFYFKAWPF